MGNTVTLHRVFAAPAARVYQAFLNPAALAKRLPPHGFVAEVHHLDAQVGGTHHISFVNLSTGHKHSFGGTYLELKPNELIRYNDQFDDPTLAGQMQVSIVFNSVDMGTEIHLSQTGIPDEIPVAACYLGWQESLQLLALLVTPTIPD